MPALHITKIHISLQVKVPHEMLQRHLPSSAEVVGEALTEQVVAAVKKHKLSYFPALEFLEKQGDLDQDLLDATETISWFACKLVREEVNKKLRAFFSELSFQSVKCTSYAMPGVRVKIDVIASLLKKDVELKGIDNWAKQLFRRNLEKVFDDFEVIQAVVLNDS